MSESNTAYNIWGVVASAIGVLGLLPLFGSLLPIAQVKALEGILSETRTLLIVYVEEEYLRDQELVCQTGLELDSLQAKTDELKMEVYGAGNAFLQLRHMLGTKPWKIYSMHLAVQSIHTDISRRALDEKMQREAARLHAPASLSEEVIMDAPEEKLDNVAPPHNLSDEDEGVVETIPGVTHDTWDTPAYHVDLVQTRYTQYTEASRTKDEGGCT